MKGRQRLVGILIALAASGAARAQDPPAAPPKRPSYLPGATATATVPRGNAYELRREKGKGWVHDAGGFVARIGEDGSVRFADKSVSIGFALPLPMPFPAGTETLEGTLRKLNPRARPRRVEPAPPTPDVVPRMSPYRPAPHDWCTYPHPCFFQARVLLINARGSFDVTDEIMRLGKQDPYRNQKAGFLASTASFRQELVARASTRARAQALDELRQRLDAIERDGGLTPAQRRAAIEALAADLDPDPAVAAPARALIEERLSPKPDAGAP